MYFQTYTCIHNSVTLRTCLVYIREGRIIPYIYTYICIYIYIYIYIHIIYTYMYIQFSHSMCVPCIYKR